MNMHLIIAAIAVSSALGMSAMDKNETNNVGGHFPYSGVYFENFEAYVKDPLKGRPGIRAAYCGELEVLEELLTTGQVNIDDKDPYNQTALHLAIWSKNSDMIKFLVNNGANVNAPDIYNTTPLMRLACRGMVNEVRLLLEEGANVTLTDNQGKTAMGYAECADFNSKNEIKNLINQYLNQP